MVTLPRVRAIDERNIRLRLACEKRLVAALCGMKESIGERLQRDRQALLPLPTHPYDPCKKVSISISSILNSTIANRSQFAQA